MLGGAPLMERPPGRLLGPVVLPGMLMGLAERPMGAPTGMEDGREPCGALRQAWMRFFPSGCVTRGCSLAVVNVYTRPVSDTTRRRTWVPVRVDSSYAWERGEMGMGDVGWGRYLFHYACCPKMDV